MIIFSHIFFISGIVRHIQISNMIIYLFKLWPFPLKNQFFFLNLNPQLHFNTRTIFHKGLFFIKTFTLYQTKFFCMIWKNNDYFSRNLYFTIQNIAYIYISYIISMVILLKICYILFLKCYLSILFLPALIVLLFSIMIMRVSIVCQYNNIMLYK